MLAAFQPQGHAQCTVTRQLNSCSTWNRNKTSLFSGHICVTRLQTVEYYVRITTCLSHFWCLRFQLDFELLYSFLSFLQLSVTLSHNACLLCTINSKFTYAFRSLSFTLPWFRSFCLHDLIIFLYSNFLIIFHYFSVSRLSSCKLWSFFLLLHILCSSFSSRLLLSCSTAQERGTLSRLLQ